MSLSVIEIDTGQQCCRQPACLQGITGSRIYNSLLLNGDGLSVHPGIACYGIKGIDDYFISPRLRNSSRGLKGALSCKGHCD